MGKKSKARADAENEPAAVEATPAKKSKKSKMEDQEMPMDQSLVEGTTELKYSDKVSFASPIAHPMAGKKLTKKILKLLKKVIQETGSPGRKESGVITGLKGVQVGVTRKNEKGLVIFAGNVTPIDVMSHLPAVCEDRDIPYIYVPLKSDISQALGVRRTTIMVLVRPNKKYQEAYEECINEVKSLFPLNV